jgi:hypothetical protein
MDIFCVEEASNVANKHINTCSLEELRDLTPKFLIKNRSTLTILIGKVGL